MVAIAWLVLGLVAYQPVDAQFTSSAPLGQTTLLTTYHTSLYTSLDPTTITTGEFSTVTGSVNLSKRGSLALSSTPSSGSSGSSGSSASSGSSGSSSSDASVMAIPFG